MSYILYLFVNYDGGILLPFTSKINCVNYTDMRFIYVNMQHNYVDMRLICVNMRNYYVHMLDNHMVT